MKTSKVKMTFVCDQEWDKMKPNGSGRHCEICNTRIYDFTEKKKTEIEQFSNGQESCGLFYPEQVDTNLIPIEIPYQNSFLKFFLTIGTITGLQLNHSRGQELPKKDSIEIVENQKVISTTQNKTGVNDTHLTPANDCDDTKPLRYERRKYFLTKRFPFIVRRKINVRVVGRYRM